MRSFSFLSCWYSPLVFGAPLLLLLFITPVFYSCSFKCVFMSFLLYAQLPHGNLSVCTINNTTSAHPKLNPLFLLQIGSLSCIFYCTQDGQHTSGSHVRYLRIIRNSFTLATCIIVITFPSLCFPPVCLSLLL